MIHFETTRPEAWKIEIFKYGWGWGRLSTVTYQSKTLAQAVVDLEARLFPYSGKRLRVAPANQGPSA